MLRFRRDARRRRRPLPVADHAGPRRACCCRRLRPRVMTAHYILPPDAEPPPARRAPAASSARWTRSSPTPSTAPPACARRSACRRERVHVIPHGAFDYLTRLPEEKPLPAELEGAEGPVDPLLRPAAPLQGDRESCSRPSARSRAPSSGSSATRGWTVEPLRELAAAAPGRVRFVTRFVDRRRDPGDLPPRRPRRPALPRRRAVRRPLHRPRLRQADGAQRRRRLPRGRRDRRRPAGRRPATPPRSPRR